jgi:sugar lactone lactonase YvrE
MKHILLFFVILVITLTTVAWVRYGGGNDYPDLSSTPLLNSAAIEEVLGYPEPVGNVAISADGRLFFTVHPESRPQGNRLLEHIDGAAIPFPDVQSQLKLFDTVLGITVDQQNRLWTIDHGNHGMRTPRLLGFDLRTGLLIHDERFTGDIAPAGSLLADIRVSADGRTIIISDSSYWRKRPALIVYDIESGVARRVLEGDDAVAAEPYVIRNGDHEMSFIGGVVALRGGVQGLALGPEWLYFGALSGSGLYRIRLADLTNAELPPTQLSKRLERYATKPLSSSMGLDAAGNVYITDVEHRAVHIVDAARERSTLIKSNQLRWPNSLHIAEDGWLYVTDSALYELIMKSREHIEAEQPYKIFRFRTATEEVSGQ